ncbi:peptidase S33 tricorn interacting factor 1 [Wolfiporia cocos MD-104 SS10]|uniref:Peptidase S33 tricorn interacting factor 1 n=1 Tax=Wolfiporia cocos (strain MD-104) TaxID=742152 RepID=A0A2H3JMV4_WOLCO|nr:peptidase S33 tricorn interacting factor 1 [Wolfiporia cocos MD-104 SS10]
MSVPVAEGYAPYDVPAAGKPCQTYYKIVGNLTSGVTPLIVLHGGPGGGHGYVSSIADLAQPMHGTIPVVLYDQLGCGRSTRLRERCGDTTFWTVQLFVDELHNLRKHLGIERYDLLGHSWGAMLGMEVAVRRPPGLRRLVLSSGPASMPLWEEATGKLLKTLPEDVQQTIQKHERAGTFESPEYKEAMNAFSKFVCRMQPWPQEVIGVFEALEEDPTAYLTMQGPSEFTITGSLKTWNVIPELHKINVPTLVMNGAFDEAQDSVVAPIFQEVEKVKWYTFQNSAHMAQWEERDKYMEIVGGFLRL